MATSDTATKEVLTRLKEIGENPEEVNLDGLNVPTITNDLKDKLQKAKDLSSLSLSKCGLTSLENFPSLPNLFSLELYENKFEAKELVKLVGKVPRLQTLLLGKNKISNHSDIESLSKLKELVHLDLANTALSKEENYREKVFVLIPSLEVLDDLDRNGNPYEFDDDDDNEGRKRKAKYDENEEGQDNDEDEDQDDEDGDEDEDHNDEMDDEEDEDDDDDEDEEVERKNTYKKKLKR